ncbi:MAG: DUF120 domain-containing protein [Limnochordaceae bacterium]|nr:DUF120 domain-containing protein [Limnochordaceae bacterium]
MERIVRGTVRTGNGHGTQATAHGWFRKAVEERYGFVPELGTLNVQVAEEIQSRLVLLEELLGKGTVLVPPSRAICCSILRRVRLACVSSWQDGLVVRPLVEGYDPCKVEIVAPVHLRTTLGLADGQEVLLRFDVPEPRGRWTLADAP